MRTLAVLLLLALAPLAAADHTGDILYDPGAAGRVPSPDEIKQVIDSLRGHPWAEVHEIGASKDAVPLYVVALTDPESTVPMEDRVVTFIMTQQHGNEPAGTPAALRLLESLRDGGERQAYLENQVLLVMPQSNPDGSLDNRRTNDDGVDINRDHVHVSTPEATAIHEVIKRWDVHFAFDHHEYGGTGIGHPSPVQTYDFDVTTMYPNHGNVREPTASLSVEFNYEHLKPRLESEGYTHGDYGIQTVTVGPVKHELSQSAGGPDPGILRNNYGLNNIAGLLIESYIPSHNAADVEALGELGLVQSFERRVASHEVVMDEVMRFAHENADRIIAAKRESERRNLEEPPAQYLEGGRTGAMPEAFRTNSDLVELFHRHGLPMPWPSSDGNLSVVAQERAGLLGAILHPESSRHVEAAQPASADGIDAAYYGHPDLGQPVVEPVEEAPSEDVPSLAPLVVLGLLVSVAALRLVPRRPE